MATMQEIADRQQFRRRTLSVAFVLLGVAFVLWLLFTLSDILFMVFVSIFLAVALEPPVHFLAKRGWRRGSATGVVFLGGLVLVIGFLWALAPLFVDQVNLLINAIPGVIDSLLSFLEDTFGFDLSEFDLENAGADIAGGLQSVGGVLVGGIVGLTASIGGFLLFATTVALFSFYMIAELPQLQRTVLSFMPEDQQRRSLHIWDIAVEKMGGYIYSRLLLAVVSATFSTLFLTLLDVPFALSLGIWVGLLSQFIPVIGTYLAAILPAIVALSSNGTSTMIWVIIFFTAYQQLENYVFSPRITKRTMEIHPAVSVAAIFIGANLMGGIGVVLALPMTGIIQAIISESRKRHDVIVDDAGGEPEPLPET
ncbi:MAG: AI-2E family transporter [Acidobacteria bacterium]|nr:MAG: AI-2E family transporter [Acidobacteriota bacterium]